MFPKSLLIFGFSALVFAAPLYAEEPEALVIKAPTAIEVEAKPYALENNGKALSRGDAVGAFTFNNALKLTSHTYVFGGFSGLAATDDQLFSVTDEGFMLRTKMIEKDGLITGFKDTFMAPIWPPNQPPKRKHDYDAEGLAWMKKGAQFMVSFEQKHRLVHYDLGDKPYIFKTREVPADVATLLEANQGIEAIAPMDDNHMVVLAENSRDPEGNLRGWIIDEDKQWAVFSLKATEAFAPTDITILPGGDALVLERSYSLFSGMQARISLIKKEDLKAGVMIESKELVRFTSGSGIDNMEGFTLQPNKDGSMNLLIISDDNSNPLQNTLLISLNVPKEIAGTASTKAKPAKAAKKKK